ncbi:MAG: fumarylacetoacetate hydrolase family protein [Lautropia sp.]
MHLCRFGNNRLGVVAGNVVRDVTAALDAIPAYRYPVPGYDLLIAHLGDVRRRVDALLPAAAQLSLPDIELLAPVANPGKIVAAPVNYRKHLDEARQDAQIHHQQQIGEIQRVGLFLKAASALVGPAQGVSIAHPERRNDHEAEVVVVIGKAGRRIPASRALDHVAGYCAGLDMTTRGPEERSLRKSIDSYAVLGPWLTTADEIADPSTLGFRLEVNGIERQRANTRDLIIDIPHLIEFASAFYTLHPGDLLFTGTPEGVGPVQPGDVITMALDGVGSMRVDVRALAAG